MFGLGIQELLNVAVSHNCAGDNPGTCLGFTHLVNAGGNQDGQEISRLSPNPNKQEMTKLQTTSNSQTRLRTIKKE